MRPRRRAESSSQAKFRAFDSNERRRGAPAGEHSRPAAKLSPRAKLLAGKRTLVLGVGGGTAVVLLLALTFWMFSGPGGVSKNGGGVSAAATGVSGPMRYLPNDCLLVATANIDELMSSSLYQQMKKDLPSLEDGERNLEQEIGIAPSNISRITLAVGGKANSNDAVVVLAIGLKTAISAADVKSKNKVQPYQKDVKYEETQVGSVTLFEETYRLAGKAGREHGTAFCMPESTLIVECSKLDVLKKVVERGKPPDFSEAMQNAMSETDFSKTLAFAVNVKESVASENFMDEFKGLAGGPRKAAAAKGPTAWMKSPCKACSGWSSMPASIPQKRQSAPRSCSKMRNSPRTPKRRSKTARSRCAIT